MAHNDPSLLELVDTPILTVRDGRVQSANARAQMLLGDHSIGKDVRLMIRNPDALDVIAADTGGRITLHGLSVPGSIWELVCKVLDDGTRLVLLEDLSVRDSVSRAHTDFVANASHELRTPLAAILGYVETLLDPKAGEEGPTRDRFLTIIRREAQRMQSLLDDLMSLSRIEATRHEAPSARLDLAALAAEVASEFGRESHIVITAPAEPVVVSGDRSQLAQVVRNLIENARKYGTEGSDVDVTLELGANGWASFSVHNDGEPIAPEHLPRLTERFYRADAGRSRAAGGTGLGLSIVKHIIVRHRGRFDITSRAGEGTIATFLLPPPQY